MQRAFGSPDEAGNRATNNNGGALFSFVAVPASAVLLVDAYIAVRVVKEGLRRISGVPTGTSVLTTMFGIGVLATAIHRIAAPALRAFRPKHPSVAGTAIAANAQGL